MPEIDDIYKNDSTITEDTSFPEFDDLSNQSRTRLLRFLQEVLIPPEEIEKLLYQSLVNQTSEEYASYVRENVYGTFNLQNAKKIDFQARLAMARVPKPITDVPSYLESILPHIRHLEKTAERFVKLVEETQEEMFYDEDLTGFTSLIDVADYALALMRAIEIIKTLSSQ